MLVVVGDWQASSLWLEVHHLGTFDVDRDVLEAGQRGGGEG